MDLNKLYREHQLLQMKAENAASPLVQLLSERSAAAIAGRIGRRQNELGAAAATAWTALSHLPNRSEAPVRFLSPGQIDAGGN